LLIFSTRHISANTTKDFRLGRHTLGNAEGIEGMDPRVQSLILINESGLYSLILRSRKTEAKRFQKWVTAEVLPSIRNVGAIRPTHALMLVGI
jgi:prophage antirepressor-like protein